MLLEPFERDLRLFDHPLMTRSLGHEIIRRGYRTTVKTMLADYERFAALFGRYGIRTISRSAIERRARRWSSAQRAVA